ncbi:MAG: type V CRISPR-associated protein Cas12k [Snowella sp.]|nr:type V CRISPR-associated protein Cas12k [Snowella sp.]
MSQITIHCRLVAKEASRQYLWDLMAKLNTPFINELLAQVREHPDFEQWRQVGKPKAGVIATLGKSLKSDPRFIGQPARFYTSAIHLVEYIFKSWLKLQRRLQSQLDGQKKWLEILKSDEELTQLSDLSLDEIRTKASDILTNLTPQAEALPTKSIKKTKKEKKTKEGLSLSKLLFDAYQKTEDLQIRSAIAYLLKNGCKLPSQKEDSKKFRQRRRKAEIKTQRLTDQLEGRLPQGRDLTGQRWLETLIMACTTATTDPNQVRSWQDKLLTHSQILPYPIDFVTNEDLIWSKNEKGRLCVHFNGLSEHSFEIYCDQRQLKWFNRFFEDQQIKRESKNQHSSALFTLRSGRIGWQEGSGKGEPWNLHYLVLYCTLDTRFWSAEGTDLVRQEKAGEITKRLTTMKEKGDLSEQQESFVQRKNSTLIRMANPFPRPSQPLYQGHSHILLGVAFGLEKPATVALVDGLKGKAITYRSLKQLLGKNYNLLNLQRQQKQAQTHERHKAQRKGASAQFGESELGQHIDRLLAQAIVQVAQSYHTGSIVVPKLGNIREIVQSEIQVRAEEKIAGSIEAQKTYAKEYRVNIHQWSYGRLIENISAQATKLGIVIEEETQVIRGSPQEEAKVMAIAAYHARIHT